MMFLLITDDGGNLVYKSRAYSKNDAAFSLAAEESILSKGGNAAFRKDVLLDGRMYHFYVQPARMQKHFGVQAAAAADRLFDVARFADTPAGVFSLSMLTHCLSAQYAAPLRESGVHLELRGLDRPWTVRVVPDAILLCLALMIRICACYGRRVKLSAVRTNGRVTIFADAAIGDGITEVPEVLSALLHEIAAVIGVSVEHFEKNGQATWSISLSPIDVAWFGLKVELRRAMWKQAGIYAKIWL